MAKGPVVGQEYNAFDLAALYLLYSGLPNTRTNRTMLASWFMAESQHGKTPGTIIVANNNPLNITGQGDAGYHNFSGNNLDFASYSRANVGAAAWWNLLNANPRYKGIITAFRAQDQVGTISAIGRSPWGTNPITIASALRVNTVDQYTGKLPDATPITSDITLYGQTFILGNVFTEADAGRLYNAIYDSGQMNGNDLGISKVIVKNTIFSFVGHQISRQMFQDMGLAVESGNPLPVANIPNPLSGIDAIAQWLTDPVKSTNRWQHVGAVALGTVLLLVGTVLLVKGVNRPKLSGGGKGGNTFIFNEYLDDSGGEEESLEEAAPEAPAAEPAAPKPPPRRRASSRNANPEWSQYDLKAEPIRSKG